MSNLGSAKAAIRAEIVHAKQGMAYYESLVTTLEAALAKLNSVGAEGPALQKPSPTSIVKSMETDVLPARRGRKPGSRNKVSSKAISKAAAKVSSKASGGKLPSTGKDFWPSLITDQPQSAPEILTAAVNKLGISPTPDQLKKLSQRATFALHTLVKSNAIADTGSGRGRRFLKK